MKKKIILLTILFISIIPFYTKAMEQAELQQNSPIVFENMWLGLPKEIWLHILNFLVFEKINSANTLTELEEATQDFHNFASASKTTHNIALTYLNQKNKKIILKKFLKQFCNQKKLEFIKFIIQILKSKYPYVNFNKIQELKSIDAPIFLKKNADPIFIRVGRDVTSVPIDNGTALMLAANIGNLEIVELLVKNGADQNIKDSKGIVALAFAARNNRKDIVGFLLKNGADEYSKFNAFIQACNNSDLEIIKLLLESGLNLNLKKYDHDSVLTYLVSNNLNNVVKLLLSYKKIDANYINEIREDANGWKRTALHVAIKENNLEMVQLLLENGADIDIKDNNYIVGFDTLEYAEDLLNCHPDTIHQSSRNKRIEIVKLLSEHKKNKQQAALNKNINKFKGLKILTSLARKYHTKYSSNIRHLIFIISLHTIKKSLSKKEKLIN